jgi:hypothetical protein
VRGLCRDNVSAVWSEQFLWGQYSFRWVNTVPREDEQAVIRQKRVMREAGAGYRQIAEWMKNTHDRSLSFMGVKRVLARKRLYFLTPMLMLL